MPAMTQVTTYLVAVGNSGPVNSRAEMNEDEYAAIRSAVRNHLPVGDRIAMVFSSGLHVTSEAAVVISEISDIDGQRFHSDPSMSASVLPHRVQHAANLTAQHVIREGSSQDAAVILLWPGLIYTFWANTQLAGTPIEHGDVLELTWDVPERGGNSELIECQLHTDRDIG